MTDLEQRLSRLSPEKRALLEQRLLQSARGEKTPAPIAQVAREGTLPLSFAQVRLWLLDRLGPESATYNIPFCFRLKGDLDQVAFEQSLTEIVRRHEVLRTSLLMADGQLVQKIALPEAFKVPVVDLHGFPAAVREEEAERLALVDSRQPFDFSRAPLMRATLLQLASDEYLLLLNVHHIAFDGWSLGVFAQELSVLYKTFLNGGKSPLPELPIQYADFAVWQRQWLQGKVLQRQLDYWKERLSGSLPVLELPADRPRLALQTYDGATVVFALSRELTEGLKALSRREGCTLFVTLMAAFQVLLLRYSGQEDILVGMPIANRSRAETEALIGFFVNTLVIRGDLSGNPKFRELLRQVRETALGAYAHQDLPFERLVEELHPERDLSRSPIFQVLLSLQNTPAHRLELFGLEVSRLKADSGTSKFDLSFSVSERPEGLSCTFNYSAELFNADRIERMVGHLRNLLEAIVADPEQRLSELPLLTEAERHELLEDWNDTAAEYPRDVPLAQLVEEQVERTPGAVAVMFEDGSSLTYRSLNERANQLAHELLKHGAGPDQLVGVCMERSVDMVVALLAIVKAGAAYVPLDPELPAARLIYMIEDSGLKILLTQRGLLSSLPPFAGPVVEVDGGEWQANSRENPDIQVAPENLAYVIYTSGSTGRPKGVEISFRALINFLWCMRHWLQLKSSDTLLAVTTISFDIAGMEVWLPLLVGARCVVASRASAADGRKLREMIEHWQVSFLQATPVTWQLLLAAGWQGKLDLTTVCGGETMPRELAAQLRPLTGRLWNLYGPTETTIWSTGWLVEKGHGPVLIGRPVANTQCYILDEQRQPVPIGVIGELYISGDGLARGYRNRPELTEEKFVPNPFVPEKRMYRTGDLARCRADGNIECLGRTDHQVKLRGFRIELGEIESALKQHTGIDQCVVVAREDEPGDKRLVAYVVTVDPHCAPDAAGLREFLKQKLPEYMVPTAFVLLPELPLSPNGKVDRKSLPAPEGDAYTARGYEAPLGEVETNLARIWEDLLRVKRIGRHDHFFELGGHSLLATQFVSRFREAFGVEVALRSLFERPTVFGFAEYIEAIRWTSVESMSSVVALDSDRIEVEL